MQLVEQVAGVFYIAGRTSYWPFHVLPFIVILFQLYTGTERKKSVTDAVDGA